MKKVITIIWARPQFIKHAPVNKIIKKYANNVVIHTGQHFDKNMSDIFFKQLEIDTPDYELNINWWNHWEMTWKMMIEIEKIILIEIPDFIIIYWDTNSTLAWALVWSKLNIPVIHIEAWLRSFDKTMPEEINRIMTDHIAKYLLCPTEKAIENLKNEWINTWVFHTQDPMYLTVNHYKDKTLKFNLLASLWLSNWDYYFATVHRPSNTDNVKLLNSIINLFNWLNKKVIFPIHPRTKQKIDEFWINMWNNITTLDPTWYLETLYFMQNSDAVITDSWGLQKEAYILWKNIFTLRDSTEWMETVETWKNILLLNKYGDFNIYDTLTQINTYRWGTYTNYYNNGNKLEELICKILKKWK